MEEEITEIVSKFEDALTVSMMGLEDAREQFEPLKVMADAALGARAKGSFERCEKAALSISSLISSLVKSTMESKVSLQEGFRTKYTKQRNLTAEAESFPMIICTTFCN
jgi:hypothetical protein